MGDLFGLNQQTDVESICVRRVSFLPPISSPIFSRPNTMPRKAATAAGDAGEAAAPRRSSRIKEQPKEAPAPKKAPAKPRAKKADKEGTDKEEKPKAARGTKRKAAEEPNGTAEDEEAPAAKKVRLSSPPLFSEILKHSTLFVRLSLHLKLNPLLPNLHPRRPLNPPLRRPPNRLLKRR